MWPWTSILKVQLVNKTSNPGFEWIVDALWMYLNYWNVSIIRQQYIHYTSIIHQRKTDRRVLQLLPCNICPLLEHLRPIFLKRMEKSTHGIFRKRTVFHKVQVFRPLNSNLYGWSEHISAYTTISTTGRYSRLFCDIAFAEVICNIFKSCSLLRLMPPHGQIIIRYQDSPQHDQRTVTP